jgi:hypothetical protein
MHPRRRNRICRRHSNSSSGIQRLSGRPDSSTFRRPRPSDGPTVATKLRRKLRGEVQRPTTGDVHGFSDSGRHGQPDCEYAVVLKLYPPVRVRRVASREFNFKMACHGSKSPSTSPVASPSSERLSSSAPLPSSTVSIPKFRP